MEYFWLWVFNLCATFLDEIENDWQLLTILWNTCKNKNDNIHKTKFLKFFHVLYVCEIVKNQHFLNGRTVILVRILDMLHFLHCTQLYQESSYKVWSGYNNFI